MIRRLVPFILTLIVALTARAGMLIDVDATVAQDALTSSSDKTSTKNLYGVGVYVPLDSKNQYYLGATFLGGASSDTASTGDVTFSHQDIILGAKWFIDKNQTFILSSGYGFKSNATYQNGTAASESWTGSSLYAKLTVAPKIGKFNAGMSIIYYSGSYTEKNVSGTTSSVSNSRTFIIPGFALAYSW